VLSVVLRGQIVRLLLEHGTFSAADTRAVSTVFAILSAVFLIYAFAQILTFAFFALQDTTRFLSIVVAGIGLNIALDVALVARFGVPGLAAATLIAAALSNSASWALLARRIGGLDIRANFPFALRSAAAAAVGGLAAWLPAALAGGSPRSVPVIQQAGLLALCVCAGGTAYVLASHLLGIDEVVSVWLLVKERLHRARGAKAADPLPPENPGGPR
jgi:putative peptidoglycan lipid II flippase